jgi:mono/diheme cytochrome c family protein
MMVRSVGMGALAAALLALGAMPGGAEEQEAGATRADIGAELYQQHCGACHGIYGDGKGPVAPVLREAPSDLTRIAARRGGIFPEAEMMRVIDGRDPIVSHGPRDMPVWGKRFAEGMAPSAGAEAARRGYAMLLVEYLKTIQVTEPEESP